MDFLNYVNILQGTKSVPRFSSGNTLPLLQQPFGFASFSPQTNSDRGAWFYHPEDRSYEGFRLTRQPSPWIGDWCPLVFTVQTEMPYGAFWQSWSGFDPRESLHTPAYMKCVLKRPQAVLELTPSMYGAMIRAEFHGDRENFLTVQSSDCDYSMWLEGSRNRLHCSAFREFGREHLRSFCVVEFPQGILDPSRSYGEDSEGRHLSACENVLHRAYHLAVDKKKFSIRLAVSYISDEQAVRNLEAEKKWGDFDTLKKENERLWNQCLGTIRIQAEQKVMETFYSCMYRGFLFPHRAYEFGEAGEPVHFAPSCNEVRPGVRYTDNGFWDTYRTVYPFLTIVAPDRCREILEGYLNDYRDSGWLPRWTAGAARDCMPGTAIDAVLADAAVKGILKGQMLEKAFEAMEKNANEKSSRREYGRTGIEDFCTLGYMPCDRYGESVNLTLDAAYADGCIGAAAGVLGKQDKQDYYVRRSQNYRNLYDPDTGFMRGRDWKGAFQEDFDPCRWGGDYTEASAWQTTFAVQHDLEGLARLMGGRDALLRKLDAFFQEPPRYLTGSYRQEIHEMTEMAACDLGQFAISNQPSFHIPYIYAYFGEPEKAAYWVRRACGEHFSPESDGFPGDEDNGSMALWYVFSVLGIYPICPGKPVYTHIPPMADSLWILGRQIDLNHYGNRISHQELMEEIGGKSPLDGDRNLV